MTTGLLHHVELYVNDLAAARAFWDWFLAELGYAQFQCWDQGVSWKLGETYLVFVQTAEAHRDVPHHRCRAGLNHLAFHAASRAHVDEITAKLRERGVTILYEDRHPFAGGPDYYAVFFEAPERFKVELVAP
ncbi:MAG: VOC family protein [Myxococcota bacterium]